MILTSVEFMQNLTIVPINAFSDNYIWLIINSENKQAICVDPGDAKPVMTYLNDKQLTLSSILITHHHYDHIGGMMTLKNNFPNAISTGPADPRIHGLDKHLSQDDTFRPSGFELDFNILFTPGHTSHHICYHEAQQNWLFCGDTLFSAGCGRLFEGTSQQMHQSLSNINQLDEETEIYCTHEYTLSNLLFAQSVEPNNHAISDYISWIEQHPNTPSLPSTLAKERRVNPFLRCNQKDIINYAKACGAISEDVCDVFAIIRQMKDSF